jgi:hypothetical protein
MAKCVEEAFEWAIDSMPFDSAEGGYVGGRTWSTRELLADHLEIGNERVIQAMMKILGADELDEWTQRYP